jgi:hypothetical protein
MAEMILPGVYIEVRPEGLIAPGQITVGNVGVVGTASKGTPGTPVLLGSYAEAQQQFGNYDPWLDPNTGIPVTGPPAPLTLVRALEIAFNFGATTVYAVRVAGTSQATAAKTLLAGTDPCVNLSANSPGTWANGLWVSVAAKQSDVFIEDEPADLTSHKLRFPPQSIDPNSFVPSARDRVSAMKGGIVIPLAIITTGAPTTQQVLLAKDGTLTFNVALKPDRVFASYVVDKANTTTVTLHFNRLTETYNIVDGTQLADLVNSLSAWATATAQDSSGKNLPGAGKLPNEISSQADGQFSPGKDGGDDADYQVGLDALLNQNVHIMIAAGKDDSFGNTLDRHCQLASTDAVKHDRIAVVGTGLAEPKKPGDLPIDPNNQEDTFFQKVIGHNIDSDRVILVSPGIKWVDAAADPPADVTLPGAYTAAAVAGLLASFPPHISLTNKTLAVDDLEIYWDDAHLTQLVQNRVLAIENRQGFHVVKGITTTTGGAFAQISIRRIVDYAKFGVRSAASPYIGLLNNERVRGALRATINSFLAGMVQDEMLVSYDLSVTATRDDEIKGIANVTLTLQPTFSIDFIKVTMFLQ